MVLYPHALSFLDDFFKNNAIISLRAYFDNFYTDSSLNNQQHILPVDGWLYISRPAQYVYSKPIAYILKM